MIPPGVVHTLNIPSRPIGGTLPSGAN
uniref:Uncharacterized protein n=1 Tax=Anguilla anguilla TaxID=7936 RepID=A0A0E9RE84_ANGAN